MTRQQLIIGISIVIGQLLQPLVYTYLIAPLGRVIERGLRRCRWPRLLRFLTKPRLPGLY